MKRLIRIFLISLMIFNLLGCSTSEPVAVANPVASNDQPDAVEEQVEQVVVEVEAESGSRKLGEVYSDGKVSYNILGFRTAAEDGLLFMNMEVRNDSSESLTFVTMERLILEDESGEECTLELFVSTEKDLGGEIPAGNKIQGEVAFSIPSFDSGDYTLTIGEFYDDYKEAYTFTPSDFVTEYASVFENSEIESEYTIGTPVASDVFTITLNDATVEASDQEGMETLVCDFTFLNNTDNTESYLINFILEAYDSEGTKLDLDDLKVTIKQSVSPKESEQGIVAFKIKEGTRDFYIVVTPDISKQKETSFVVFSVE